MVEHGSTCFTNEILGSFPNFIPDHLTKLLNVFILEILITTVLVLQTHLTDTAIF